jgi:Rhs element Vgr protein
MAKNTSIKTGGMATFAVKVNGTQIPGELRVYSILVEKKINRVPTARIVILDGEADTGKFDASSSATFLPGGTITIEAGYDAVNQQIFKGIITGQSIRIDDQIGSSLEVECYDVAVKMTVGRKSHTYSKKRDSDIITSIASNYSGISAIVASTNTAWPEQVQYYVTDWDFILTRAEANGMIVTALDGQLTVDKPDADTSSVLTIQFGDNLLEFSADLNAISQLGNVKASTWDYKNQVIASTEAANDHDGPGNLTSKKLAEVIGLADYELQTAAPLENADLTDWCKAQLVKSEYSKIQGEVKFQGTALVAPAKYITLQGVGDRFNGDHLVSGIMHDISEGNWVTVASFGLPVGWFIEQPDVVAQPASGLLPAARGLLNGTVKKMYDDPENQFRILVDVPLFGVGGHGIWARLTNFYSTNGAGAFFMPEVGDEVILGFLNEDPRYPIILGSVYNGQKNPPFTGLQPDEKNTLKAIVSKSGMYIQFNDDKKILTITTPQNNTIIIDDDQAQIKVIDQNNNIVLLSSDGITVTSFKDITLTADGKVNITGKQGVTIKAPGGDVEVKGINIKETADSQYSSEGGQLSKITGGMELVLQSAMIMIN